MRLLIAISALSGFLATAHSNPRGPAVVQPMQSIVVQKVTDTFSEQHRLLAEGSSGFFCGIFSALTDEELSSQGITCTCSESDTELNLSCEYPGTITDPEYGSVSDVSITMTMSLDGIEDGNVEGVFGTCATYGDDVEIEELRNDKFCFEMTMSFSMEDTAAEDALPTISKCTASLAGKDCGCKPCDNGFGMEMSCPGSGGALAVKCTDFVDEQGNSDGDGTNVIGSVLGQGTSVQRFERAEPSESGGGSVIPAVAPFVVSVLGYVLASALF